VRAPLPPAPSVFVENNKAKENKMTNFEEIQQRWAEEQKTQRERHARYQRLIFSALADLQITSVEVTFDGCGDSGQIEDVTIDGASATLDSVIREDGETCSCTLAESIETLCYALLEVEYGGWEDNDGAFGTFVFDVATRQIELEFNGRFTDHDTSYRSFEEV